MKFNKNKVIGRYTIYASDYMLLDSNVVEGGGTDHTEILQSILDRAPEMGGLHLIMDGAALIRGLDLHSDTTIECLSASCGFYLAPQSNRSLLRNAHPGKSGKIQDRNIRLIGGTYNHNCRNQLHHVRLDTPDGSGNAFCGEKWVIGFEFYGVDQLTIRDLTLRNQRTFGMLFANWRNVTMENVTIDLPDIMTGQNQDGIHFWGPGQFLTMRNIKGCSGDDFIALAPDEDDLSSGITDVLIDGVFLDNADQGIRLLSREKGRLDRVVIRNVAGTYKSFGFYINPWFPGSGGNFGNLVIENVDLRQTGHKYHYTNPFLFRIGGNIDCLTLRNIYHIDPCDSRPLFEIGKSICEGLADQKHPFRSNIRLLMIDGLHVEEVSPDREIPEYISIADSRIEFLDIKNVHILKGGDFKSGGRFIGIRESAEISRLSIHDVMLENVEALIVNSGKVGQQELPAVDPGTGINHRSERK